MRGLWAITSELQILYILIAFAVLKQPPQTQTHTLWRMMIAKSENLNNERRYNDVIIQIKCVERFRYNIDHHHIYIKWAKHEGRTKSLSLSKNYQHIDFQQQIPYLMVKVGVAMTGNTNIYVFIMKIAAELGKKGKKRIGKNTLTHTHHKSEKRHKKIKAASTSIHPMKQETRRNWCEKKRANAFQTSLE